MRNRHLAGTEAVDLHPTLELVKPLVDPRLEIGGRDLDANSRLRPSETVSITCIDTIFILPNSTGPGQVLENPPGWCGRRGSNPHDFRHGNLNPARLPIPPRPRHAGRPGGAAYIMRKAAGHYKNSRLRFSRRRPAQVPLTPAARVNPRQRFRQVLGDKAGAECRAASPCSHTAADAASKAGMPWSNSPAAIPVKTSPAPAVARHAGAFSAIAARPSGAATTVSAPLISDVAPVSCGRKARLFELRSDFSSLV